MTLRRGIQRWPWAPDLLATFLVYLDDANASEVPGAFGDSGANRARRPAHPGIASTVRCEPGRSVALVKYRRNGARTETPHGLTN